MRVAVIGSRGLLVEDLEKYLPDDTTGIISGGAKGVDASAQEYALRHGLKLTEYLPEYSRYGRGHPAETQHHDHRKRRPCSGFLGRDVAWNKIRDRQLREAEYPNKSLFTWQIAGGGFHFHLSR